MPCTVMLKQSDRIPSPDSTTARGGTTLAHVGWGNGKVQFALNRVP